jgi:hypothetical protein
MLFLQALIQDKFRLTVGAFGLDGILKPGISVFALRQDIVRRFLLDNQLRFLLQPL